MVLVSTNEEKRAERQKVFRILKIKKDRHGIILGAIIGFFGGGWIEGIIWHGGSFSIDCPYAKAFCLGGAVAGIAIGAGIDSASKEKILIYEAE